jgi:hypothetical protein
MSTEYKKKLEKIVDFQSMYDILWELNGLFVSDKKHGKILTWGKWQEFLKNTLNKLNERKK